MEENDDKSALISPVNTAIATQLGNPAFKTLSYLISNVIAIPAAWLEQHAQRIKDTTAARSQVTQALTTQTAKTAVSDPEINERAKAVMVGQFYRRQVNKGAVVMKTIENLQADPAPEHSDGPSEDLLAKFERHAEDASSDQLRSLFTKLLAGEIRNPGAISPRTLHVI